MDSTANCCHHILQYVAPFMRADDLLRISATCASLYRALTPFREVARIIGQAECACCDYKPNARCPKCMHLTRAAEAQMRECDSALMMPFYDAAYCWIDRRIIFHVARSCAPFAREFCSFIANKTRHPYGKQLGICDVMRGAIGGGNIALFEWAEGVLADNHNHVGVDFADLFSEAAVEQPQLCKMLCEYYVARYELNFSAHGHAHWESILRSAVSIESKHGAEEIFSFVIDSMRRVTNAREVRDMLKNMQQELFGIAIKCGNRDICRAIISESCSPYNCVVDAIEAGDIELCEYIRARIIAINSHSIAIHEITKNHSFTNDVFRALMLKWITEPGCYADLRSILLHIIEDSGIERIGNQRIARGAPYNVHEPMFLELFQTVQRLYQQRHSLFLIIDDLFDQAFSYDACAIARHLHDTIASIDLAYEFNYVRMYTAANCGLIIHNIFPNSDMCELAIAWATKAGKINDFKHINISEERYERQRVVKRATAAARKSRAQSSASPP
jgi:hypothetical protein